MALTAAALAVACGGSVVSPVRPAAPDPLNRQLHHAFPRLANQYQVDEFGLAGHRLYSRAAWWDLLILPADLAAMSPGLLGPTGAIRSSNPQAVLLAYFSGGDVNRTYSLPINDGFNRGLDSSWIVYDARGREVDLFQLSMGLWTQLLNVTTEANEYLPSYLNRAVLTPRYFDGIFYDWASTSISWINHRPAPLDARADIDGDGVAEPDHVLDSLWMSGYSRMLSNSRNVFPRGSIVVGNAGWNTGSGYVPYLNGIMIEQFMEGAESNPRIFGWAATMGTYARYGREGVRPHFSILMANSDDEQDFQFMRFALASALMFDGYFIFTNRHVPPGGYQAARWYDEYSVDIETGRAIRNSDSRRYLGAAIGEAHAVLRGEVELYNVLETPALAESLVWRRDFESGIALVNPSRDTLTVPLGGSFRKIRGTVDPAFNDGARLDILRMGPRSGAILLRVRD